MRSVSSGIWTRIVVSISYEDNHYTISDKMEYIRVKNYNSGFGISDPQVCPYKNIWNNLNSTK